jgi:hypothetical protein
MKGMSVLLVLDVVANSSSANVSQLMYPFNLTITDVDTNDKINVEGNLLINR